MTDIRIVVLFSIVAITPAILVAIFASLTLNVGLDRWFALRTQQVIADETNVTQVTDPLGGSYYAESLTTEYEKRIFEILAEIDQRGGTLKLIQEGWFQRHIADFAYETALRKQSGEKPVIGVNRFAGGGEDPKIATHPYDPTTAERQIARTPSALGPSETLFQAFRVVRESNPQQPE